FHMPMPPPLRLSVEVGERDRDLVSGIAPQLRLTEDQLAERLPSGRQRTIVNRVSWAVIYLNKAGLLSRIRRGVYLITDRGRGVLANPPPKIDIRYLAQFEGFDEFRAGSSAADGILVEPTPTF